MTFIRQINHTERNTTRIKTNLLPRSRHKVNTHLTICPFCSSEFFDLKKMCCLNCGTIVNQLRDYELLKAVKIRKNKKLVVNSSKILLKSDKPVLSRDKQSIQKLCDGCKHQSCCTGFASPLLFSTDLEKLKSIGKFNDKFLKDLTINGKTVKTIKKKDDSSTCIFWDEENTQCSIYQNRPFDCRMFPFDVYSIEGKFYWVVYSCNPDSDWRWSEEYLRALEAEPQFDEIMENIDVFGDLTWLKSLKEAQKIPFTIIREVRWKKKYENEGLQIVTHNEA